MDESRISVQVENSVADANPLTITGTVDLSTQIFGSLLLDDILRGCLRVLKAWISVGRINLVQYRGSGNTVTICSLDDDSGTHRARPKVVQLKLSRLSRSLDGSEKSLVQYSPDTEQDPMEKPLLLSPRCSGVVYLPLVMKSRSKGVLVIGLLEDRRLTRPQTVLLEFLANQLALAIHNSNAHYLERRRGRQLSMLSEIAKLAVLFEDRGDFLQSAAEFLRQGFDYDVVQIWSVGEHRESLRLSGFAHRLPAGGVLSQEIPALVRECWRNERSICNNDMRGAPGEHPRMASQLVIPVRSRGRFLSILSLESSRLEAFPPEDLNIMEGVASVIASAFDNMRLFETAQQSNEYMRAILDSARDIAILSTDINGYLITSSAGSRTIFRLSQREILGKDILTLFANSRFQTEVAAFLANPAQETLERDRLLIVREKKESYLDVTLQRVFDNEGRAIGYLCIARDATEPVLLQQKLEALSITDELTGLFNQRHLFTVLLAELDRSNRYGRRLSLCFLDLDGFKQFNDAHGHLQGDGALKDTAALVRQLVRSGIDTCFRYGGDEFAVIMPETTPENAQNLAERLRSALNESFEGSITASIGIAEATPSSTPESLLDRADKAMYQSKSRGGNCVTIASL